MTPARERDLASPRSSAPPDEQYVLQHAPDRPGYDASVPLIDSGIYVCVGSGERFVSCILYSCAAFDEEKAAELTREYFKLSELDSFVF